MTPLASLRALGKGPIGLASVDFLDDCTRTGTCWGERISLQVYCRYHVQKKRYGGQNRAFCWGRSTQSPPDTKLPLHSTAGYEDWKTGWLFIECLLACWAGTWWYGMAGPRTGCSARLQTNR